MINYNTLIKLIFKNKFLIMIVCMFFSFFFSANNYFEYKDNYQAEYLIYYKNLNEQASNFYKAYDKYQAITSVFDKYVVKNFVNTDVSFSIPRILKITPDNFLYDNLDMHIKKKLIEKKISYNLSNDIISNSDIMNTNYFNVVSEYRIAHFFYTLIIDPEKINNFKNYLKSSILEASNEVSIKMINNYKKPIMDLNSNHKKIVSSGDFKNLINLENIILETKQIKNAEITMNANKKLLELGLTQKEITSITGFNPNTQIKSKFDKSNSKNLKYWDCLNSKEKICLNFYDFDRSNDSLFSIINNLNNEIYELNKYYENLLLSLDVQNFYYEGEFNILKTIKNQNIIWDTIIIFILTFFLTSISMILIIILFTSFRER